jgi:transposase
MTYSEDLRQLVVSFIEEGGSKSEAGRRFQVSRWCLCNGLGRADLAPERIRNAQPYKLDPEALKAHVEQFPDAYQHERAQALGVSRHVVLYGLKRLKLTRKKNGALRRKKRRTS